MTPKATDALELKPCPFCLKSGDIYVTHKSTNFDGKKLMSVGCCAVIFDYEPIVYERWNTRADLCATAGDAERAKALAALDYLQLEVLPEFCNATKIHKYFKTIRAALSGENK